MKHWTTNEIGVTLNCWFLMRFELASWYLSWLERLNGTKWGKFKPHLGQLPVATSKNPLVMNTIGDSSFHYTLYKISIKKNVGTDETNDQNEIWTLKKRCSWSSYNSVCVRFEFMAWYPSQLDFFNKIQRLLIQTTLSQLSVDSFNDPSMVNDTACISSFSYNLVITSWKFWLKNCDDWRRQWSKWNLNIKKMMK